MRDLLKGPSLGERRGEAQGTCARCRKKDRMITGEMEKLYPSAKALVKECVASRLHAKDASLYDFSEEARACAEAFMGWTDLASMPPFPIEKVQAFADAAVEGGVDTVVLVGQGGSTQAPMTITKYNKQDKNRVSFKTLDSDSPVRVRELLAAVDPAHTLVLMSSKSGSTIEPRLLLSALRDAFCAALPEGEVWWPKAWARTARGCFPTSKWTRCC